MEANEIEKSIKQNFWFSCTMNMELENVYLLKWLFLMSEKDMNENVLKKNYERCGLNFFFETVLTFALILQSSFTFFTWNKTSNSCNYLQHKIH